jgi:hypothetical protein
MPRLKKTAQAQTEEIKVEPKVEETVEFTPKKKGGRPKKEQPAVSEQPKEEVKQEPVKEKVKAEKVKKEEPKEEVSNIYPETFTTPKGNIYTRRDDMDWTEFKNLVNTGANFPVRLLTKEPERPKVTEFIVTAVLKYFHCVDVSSKDDDYETEVRGEKEHFDARQWFDLPMAIYTVQRPEPKKEEPPKEEVKEESPPKRTLKRSK